MGVVALFSSTPFRLESASALPNPVLTVCAPVVRSLCHGNESPSASVVPSAEMTKGVEGAGDGFYRACALGLDDVQVSFFATMARSSFRGPMG